MNSEIIKSLFFSRQRVHRIYDEYGKSCVISKYNDVLYFPDGLVDTIKQIINEYLNSISICHFTRDFGRFNVLVIERRVFDEIHDYSDWKDFFYDSIFYFSEDLIETEIDEFCTSCVSYGVYCYLIRLINRYIRLYVCTFEQCKILKKFKKMKYFYNEIDSLFYLKNFKEVGNEEKYDVDFEYKQSNSIFNCKFNKFISKFCGVKMVKCKKKFVKLHLKKKYLKIELLNAIWYLNKYILNLKECLKKDDDWVFFE